MMKSTAPAILGVLALGGAIPQESEFVFEQTTVVSIGGEAVGPGARARVLVSGRRVRLEAGDEEGGPALLLWLDQGRAFRLDPERRLAREVDAARLRARSHEDAAVASGLIGGAEEGELRTKRLPGSRTIGGHRCHGYRLSGPAITMDVWVAEDLPVGIDAFAEFLEWSGAAQSLGGLLAHLRRLPGFPMETRSRVSLLGETREAVTTVSSIQIGPQPRERFELPPGWSVVPESP
jgi:hypothetical protein